MPSVMRVAPTPLYNSFTDVYKFITILYEIFQEMDSASMVNMVHNNDEMMTKETFQMVNNENDVSSDSDSLAGTNTL